MGAPSPPKAPPAPPPPASMVDPSLTAVRDRERARRRARYGQKQTLLTSQYGAKQSSPMATPMLMPQAK